MDIKEFQRSRGLIADGIVGKNTIKEFKKAYNLNDEMVAHFLGQTYVESNGFKEVEENLNYSAKGLAETWPSRYAVDPRAIIKVPNALAKHLERKPQEIANNAYADRMGNGNEDSGDGWKHRGFGYIQLTGKKTQDEFSEYVGDSSIKAYPDKIATIYPLESALFYFHKHNLFKNISKVDYATIKNITKRINGGYSHIDRRKYWTEYFYKKAISSR